MSKHGGSPASGLVVPAGIEGLQPHVPNGMVLVPQEVVDAREQAKKREERALQLERRRVALEVFPACSPPIAAGVSRVDVALVHADELIAKTGGGI